MPQNNPENISTGISIPELNTPFLFSARGIDLPADLRPAWRIGIIVLLMKLCCRESKARFRQLHVLNWGVRNKENREILTRAVTNAVPLDTLIVRIEPSLNRAVDLALGIGLIERIAGDQLKLTDKGAALADTLLQMKGIFQEEKTFMAAIKKRVNEKFVGELFG